MNTLQKETWIKEMQHHQDVDSLVQGKWFENGKGCFFGCAMQTDEDALEKAAEAMGLPFWIVELAEAIFEGLEREEALKFPVEFLKAIPVDTDLEIVKHKIAVLRLSNLPHQCDEITNVINLHKRVIDGEDVTEDEWFLARSAARSIAEWSARSAAEARSAWSAERSARSARSAWSAWSAAQSARSAADSIAEWSTAEFWKAASAAEARSEFWKVERDNLIKTLKDLNK
jgi:hypothetical protein